jgi:hypothetical protein
MEYAMRRTAIERPYEALSELRLPPNKNRGKNKRVAKRQLPRNHFDPRKNVSARRNVLPGVSPHKNMSINVNSNFRASFLDRAMVIGVWRGARGMLEDSQFSRAERPDLTAPYSKL